MVFLIKITALQQDFYKKSSVKSTGMPTLCAAIGFFNPIWTGLFANLKDLGGQNPLLT